jgi:hypothetical protein
MPKNGFKGLIDPKLIFLPFFGGFRGSEASGGWGRPRLLARQQKTRNPSGNPNTKSEFLSFFELFPGGTRGKVEKKSTFWTFCHFRAEIAYLGVAEARSMAWGVTLRV